MHRAGLARGWWLIRARVALLVASLAAVVIAAVSLTAAAEPADIGSIDAADATFVPSESSGQRPTSGQVDDPVSRVGDGEGGAGSAVDEGIAHERRVAAGPTVPDIPRSSAQLSGAQEGVLVPVRLRVEALDVDAPLDASGVREDGLMEIPDDGDRAAWYRYGATAGSGTGSVVLAGHVDTPEGLGAMAALLEVSLGALVEVEMSDGSVVMYEVMGRETIAKDDLPSDDIFDREGPERLTLITCGGPWRASESSYRDNVVVVATPVDER